MKERLEHLAYASMAFIVWLISMIAITAGLLIQRLLELWPRGSAHHDHRGIFNE
jgi:hypothetical protein